jgi:hypothetical protein
MPKDISLAINVNYDRHSLRYSIFTVSLCDGSSTGDENEDSYNEDTYELIKAQSIQLNRLADMVESLQSQVKQLLETTRLRKHLRSRSVRKESSSNKGIKTKISKKTTRRKSTRSKQK